jgi:glycosyltransferase involved in cell wall biosynthesis
MTGCGPSGGAITVSIVIPARNEAGRIGDTVRAARAAISDALTARTLSGLELIVVDDASEDGTVEEAAAAGARVLRLKRRRGKGEALSRGIAAASGRLLLLLDGDLGPSAEEARRLLEPLLAEEADMTIGVLPPAPGGKGGGFGLVLRLAHWGLRRAEAPALRAPLSGQRGLTRAAWDRIGRLDPGFGVEIGLNLDAFRIGLRVREVPVDMRHRVTGRDWPGFRHRGLQFRDILRSILRRGRARRGHGR